MPLKINKQKCTGKQNCPNNGVCVAICALNNITFHENYPQISQECAECELCAMNCPTEAIYREK